jgi:hypothetical protein
MDELPRNFTSNETLWWYCPAMRDAGNLFLYPLRKLAKTHGPLRSDADGVRPTIFRFLFEFPLEHDYAFPTQDVACYALNVGALTPWFWLVVSLGLFWLCAEDYISAWLHWAADARDAILWHASPDLRRVDANAIVDPDESDESSQGTEAATESALTSGSSAGSDSLAEETTDTFSIGAITNAEWDESTDDGPTTAEFSLSLSPSADGDSGSEDGEDSEPESDSALAPLSFVSGERHPRLSHPREAVPVLLL